jgi:3-hydroxyisobutyrate dehydrogenase
MTLHSIQHVGFIGLGAMGKPIAVNLIKRLPQNITIHLFDVVEAPVDELCAQYPGRVVKKGSAKQTAESSVCISHQYLNTPTCYNTLT